MKLSDVSERKKERESMPSNVVASEPPEPEIQVPFTAKHPVVKLSPVYKVDVPDAKLATPEIDKIEPGVVVPIPT